METNKRSEFISVVIPDYNESRRIAPIIERMYDYLKDQSRQFEIVVVDDGSTDNTKMVLDQIENRLPLVRCVSYPPTNHDKGYAMRQGATATLGEIILEVPIT